jgi:hypothetical protein
MDIEIKFKSKIPIYTKSLGYKIIDICNENNWELVISDKWKNDDLNDE